MPDERIGCPSASTFGRLNDCPGSFSLGKAAPPQQSSAAATFGTNVHAGCAGEKPMAALTESEQETVKALLVQHEQLLQTFTDEGWKVVEKCIERRYWDEATESRWSGKADVVYILQKNKQDIALIIDYKSTRYTTNAAESLQLAALATLVDRDARSELTAAHVALVFPDGYDIAMYDADGLELASEECKRLVDRATITETNNRTPSPDACKWCNAKSICPEARGQLQVAATAKNTAIALVELPRFLSICKVAKSVIKDIEEQAKAALRAGETVEGWELTKGQTRSKITDTQEAYRRAAILGIDGETFSKQVTISKKDLEALVRNELDQKGKKAKETVENLIAGCTTESVTEPSLKEVKK